MTYDYSKLIGKIIEIFGTRKNFAKALGISGSSLTERLKGIRPWRQSEIEKSCELLGLDKDELGLYFFTLKVRDDRINLTQ